MLNTYVYLLTCIWLHWLCKDWRTASKETRRQIASISVHLGTESWSKSYRVYDLTSGKIVVRKDVVFDENRCWKWNNIDKGTYNELRIITFGFGELESKGTREDEIVAEKREDVSDDDDKITIEEDDSSKHESQVEQEPLMQQIHHILRRSTWQTTIPSYIDDYILLAELLE